MNPNQAKNIWETESFILDSIEKMEKKTDLLFVILDKETKEFLWGSWLHNINTPIISFGIRIKKSAHGHKYGKEAVFALKQYTDQNFNYEYIKYPIERKNIPSKKIIEALWGKIFDEYKKKDFGWREQDMLEYRIYPNK